MNTGIKGVQIRQGLQSDGPALVRILASHRMATDIDPSEFIVAEVEGAILGAARLTWIETGHAFLRPIAVAEGAQGKGIGRTLLEHFFGMCGSISVISRSDAAAFYRHLGFTVVDWSLVPGVYREECEGCYEMAQCRPVSMRWTSKKP